MKTIMSFWSEPYIRKFHNAWLREETWKLSWILSVACLKKQFQQVSLCTDDYGRYLLVEKLGLKFDSVSTALNDLPRNFAHFYCLAKSYTASLQEESFLHFDYDFFVRERINLENLTDEDVIFENKTNVQDVDITNYISESIFENCDVPSTFTTKQNNIYGSAIFGGRNSSFYKNLHNLQITTLNNNKEKFDCEFLRTQKNSIVASRSIYSTSLEHKSINYLLSNNKITPKIFIDDYKSDKNKFAHVGIEKARKSELYGKIIKRLITDHDDCQSQVQSAINKDISLPRTAVVIIPNVLGNVYDTIINIVVSKNVKYHEFVVSTYNLNKHVYKALQAINNITLVPAGADYKQSLRMALHRVESDMIILVDENMKYDRDALDSAIANYIDDNESVYCATVINKNTSMYLQGEFERYGSMLPNIHMSYNLHKFKVDNICGGFYVISKKNLSEILNNSKNDRLLCNLVKGYKINQFCSGGMKVYAHKSSKN